MSKRVANPAVVEAQGEEIEELNSKVNANDDWVLLASDLGQSSGSHNNLAISGYYEYLLIFKTGDTIVGTYQFLNDNAIGALIVMKYYTDSGAWKSLVYGYNGNPKWVVNDQLYRGILYGKRPTT